MNAIKVEGLYKTYDNFTLKNINFEIKPGEIIGLIGGISFFSRIKYRLTYVIM